MNPRYTLLSLLVLTVPLMAGCSGDGGGGFTGPSQIAFGTLLGPGQEVGPVVDPDRGATGSATVTVPSGLANLRVSIRSQGLANVTAAHIHVGRLGENGPVAMSLFDARTQTWSDDYNITADASRLNTNTVPNVRALFQAIRENRAYINVHTQANPGGAIRGQLGESVTLQAELSGGQEVPPNGSAGSGTAVIRLNREMTAFTLDLETRSLTGVAAAHIHVAGRGTNGPIIFPLFAGGGWPGRLTVTMDPSKLTPAGPVPDFAGAVRAMLGRGTYVNVHSQTVPSGEIRGQVEPPTEG